MQEDKKRCLVADGRREGWRRQGYTKQVEQMPNKLLVKLKLIPHMI